MTTFIYIWVTISVLAFISSVVEAKVYGFKYMVRDYIDLLACVLVPIYNLYILLHSIVYIVEKVFEVEL